MRKPMFYICNKKGADQLRSNCEADQRLCFNYTIHILLISKISNFYPASTTVQAGLCRTWSKTLKTGFLALQLKEYMYMTPLLQQHSVAVLRLFQFLPTFALLFSVLRILCPKYHGNTIYIWSIRKQITCTLCRSRLNLFLFQCKKAYSIF